MAGDGFHEGGVREELVRRVGELVGSGGQVIVLLARSDDGAPSFSGENAAALTDLMATAIQRGDITRWASEHDTVVAG